FRRNLTEARAAVATADARVAANTDGADGDARRLGERIRAVLGGDARSVHAEPSGGEIAVTVHLAEHTDGTSSAPVAERLRGAGLVPSGPDGFRSADPGAPARVTLHL